MDCRLDARECNSGTDYSNRRRRSHGHPESSQSGVDFPAASSRFARSMGPSSLPALASASIRRFHASASNSSNHARNAARSSCESAVTCDWISCSVGMSGIPKIRLHRLPRQPGKRAGNGVSHHRRWWSSPFARPSCIILLQELEDSRDDIPRPNPKRCCSAGRPNRSARRQQGAM